MSVPLIHYLVEHIYSKKIIISTVKIEASFFIDHLEQCLICFFKHSSLEFLLDYFI